MGNVTLRISYDDRLGLIKDVSAIFLKYGLNVEAFQLMNRMMTVEICENPTAPWGKILAEIKTVPLILSVECVDEISFDPRKKRMSAILDSVSPSGDPSDSFDEIVGDSAAMREVLTLARRVARTDSTVMLRGESGTGKELFAAAISYRSIAERSRKICWRANYSDTGTERSAEARRAAGSGCSNSRTAAPYSWTRSPK